MRLDKSLDADDPQARMVLEKIQSNILQAHNREHVRLLVLRFGEPCKRDVRTQHSPEELEQFASQLSEIVAEPEGGSAMGPAHLEVMNCCESAIQQTKTHKVDIKNLALRPADQLNENEHAQLFQGYSEIIKELKKRNGQTQASAGSFPQGTTPAPMQEPVGGSAASKTAATQEEARVVARSLLKHLKSPIQAHERTVARRELKLDEKQKIAEALADVLKDMHNAWKESELRPRDKKPMSDPAEMVLLSYSGYRALGLKRIAPKNRFFRQGMKAEKEYGENIDGLILLADGDSKRLDGRVERIKANLKKAGIKVVASEEGKSMTHDFGDGEGNVPIEHFGFRDGISQPRFFKKSTVGPKPQWDAETPLNVVLLEDPGAVGNYGSFMAYQKLKQNVEKFDEDVRRLATHLGVGEEEAYALTVGRYKDGKPLLTDERGSPLPKSHFVGEKSLKNFDFRNDPHGQRCPFHAHIRKMNPRGETSNRLELGKEREKRLRIARRGIPYETKDGNGTAEKGLLFMSFQSDLAQFRFHSQAAQSPDFSRAEVGVDAITGEAEPPESQTWSHNGRTIQYLIAKNVELKGGEYFFAPSIPVVDNLKGFVKKYDRTDSNQGQRHS